MPATSILPPFAQFTDRTGEPLQNGYIYIGTPGLDAQTNPITAYWDDAFSIPAAQPIRTTGGYPYRNGTPARVYVPTDFSITVLDNDGAFVYGSLTGAFAGGGSGVSAFYADRYTATAGQTTFTLTTNPASINALDISVNGSTLVPGDDFTWVSTTVTLTAPLIGGERVLIRYTASAGTATVLAGSVTDVSVATGSKLYNRINDWVSVKDFGAVGDGVTDDTAAIQAALNAAVGIGLTVYMPHGTYKTTATLNWPADWPVSLVGDGIEATHINYTGAATAMNMYDAGASTKYIKSSLENLRLSGNGTTSTNGVNIRQGYAIALRNVRVYNFEVGVRIEQTWSVILDFVRIDSCSQVGLELHNEANNVACYCCEFLDNAKGVYTAGARSVLFSECTLEANTQYGAYVTATSADSQSESVVFHGCYIEANTTNDIRIISDSGPTSPQSVIVRDCYFVGMASKATIAVRVDQANHVVIDGCDFSTGTATYGYSLYITDAGSVDKIRFGKNRDASTNGVYRGTGTTYSNETKQEARAWGRFTVSGGAIASTNGFGISGISRISTGVYEVTLLEAMSGTDYAIVASAENGAAYVAMLCSPGQPSSTTVFRINTATDASTAAEARTVNFSVFA